MSGSTPDGRETGAARSSVVAGSTAMPSAKTAASSIANSKPTGTLVSSKPTSSIPVSSGVVSSVFTPARKPLKEREKPKAVLRFSPKAWMKILWFRGRGDSEIAGFGISFMEDPLYVVDFYTVRQEASVSYFEMDDEDVNRFLTDCVQNGLHPSEVMRIFIHTHPGNSCTPSTTDENCFARVFGDADWSIMCIVAKDDSVYSRAQFTAGPGGAIELKHEVDWSPPFEGVSTDEYKSWEDEYLRNIKTTTSYVTHQRAGFKGYQGPGSSGYGQDYYANQHGGHAGCDARDWDRNAWGGCSRGSTGFEEEKKETVKDEKAGFGDEPKTKSTHRVLPDRGHPFPPEDDPLRWGMLSDTAEKVWLVLADATRKTVYTDASFYVYPLDATLLVAAGDVVETLHDVCLVHPTIRGEVQWYPNKVTGQEDTWTPIRKTVLSSNGGFVDIISRAGTARHTNGVPATVTEPTSKVASESKDTEKADDTPGFSDEPDPNKTAKHDVIEVDGDEHTLVVIDTDADTDAGVDVEKPVTIDGIECVLAALSGAQELLVDAASALAIAEYQGAVADEFEASAEWGIAHDHANELEDEYDALVARFNDENPDSPILPEAKRIAAIHKNMTEEEAAAYDETQSRAKDASATKTDEVAKEVVHEVTELGATKIGTCAVGGNLADGAKTDESKQQTGFASAEEEEKANDKAEESQDAEVASDDKETIFGTAGP